MGITIRWLGHAAFEITGDKGEVIYIDPWLEGNPACPVQPDSIKRADLILVTHDHFDHISGVAELSKRTGAPVVTVPETAAKLKDAGAKILFDIGMNIGGTVPALEGVTVTMVQAFHSSESGAPAGYIIRFASGRTVYHAGDTGIFASMELLGRLYEIDVALLPIGSVFTMDPAQAARAAAMLLKPGKVVIPMHYRTFPGLVQDAGQFLELVQKEAPGVKVQTLEPGQTYEL